MSRKASICVLAAIGAVALWSAPHAAVAGAVTVLGTPAPLASADRKALREAGHRHWRKHGRHHRFRRHHRHHHFRHHHLWRHHGLHRFRHHRPRLRFHFYLPHPHPHYHWNRPPRYHRHFHHKGHGHFGSNELAGALVGGALGAVIGSEIGHGKAAAVVGGAVVGAIVGGHVGRAMDDAHRRHAAHVLETSRTGHGVEWRNPDTGHRYSMTPTRTYRNGRDLDCRDYTILGRIDGREETLHGTACRNDDGTWRLDA